MKLFNYEIKKAKPTNLSFPPVEEKLGKFDIVKTATTIGAADAGDYKQAFLSSRARYTQERSKIYDYYQNALDFDAHLKGLIQHRLLSTAGRKIEYIVNDQPSEQVQEFIDSPVFEKFIYDYLMADIFWGMGLVQFDKDEQPTRNWLRYTMIPIKHIDPYAEVVRRQQYSVSDGDKSYKGMKNVMFIGDKESFGLLQQLSLLAMYKRAATNDWASYSQLASTNFRVVKYKGALPGNAQRSAIRDIVDNVANGTLDYSQLDMDVTTENQTSSSQNQLFENYVAYLDDQMTKLVLGQTMTTEDGSSRSQAEVHERTQESIFDADAKRFINFMNYHFADIQEMYAIPTGGQWRYAESNTGKQEQELERDLKLKELGYVFTQEELAEKYDLKPKTI